jgi:uncharacterized membrane protein YoaK (UPF0700 family)
MARKRLASRDPGHEIPRNERIGVPGGASGPNTPTGELAQFRNFTSGLTRQTGRRRTAARIGAAVILLLIVGVAVAAILAAR